MSKKNNEASQPSDYPRAPPFDKFDDNVLTERPLPPTYEESLRQPQFHPMHGNTVPSMSNQSFMASPMAYQTYGMSPQQPPVLYLAKGAEIRRTATGAICIPPPPPGYAPTPAQWAAMQGQTVLVKEPKKRSFFS